MMKKLLRAAAATLLTALLGLAPIAPLQAAEIELLDAGIYGYVGFGLGAAVRTGAESSDEYTQQEGRTALALGGAAQSYGSLNLGLIWKRRNIPGWQSMFQLSYRPLSFAKSSGSTIHAYGQRILSVDFMESYGYFNGWMPFVGLSISNFGLSFNDRSDGNPEESGQVAGISFLGGWDLVSKPTSRLRIRTNFRWHPEVSRAYQGEKVVFPNVELEVVQFVVRF